MINRRGYIEGSDWIGIIAMCGWLFITGCALGAVLVKENGVVLSNDVANDVCSHLTNNSASIASTEQGKLVCETPSYDHTSSIIVRPSGSGGQR